MAAENGAGRPTRTLLRGLTVLECLAGERVRAGEARGMGPSEVAEIANLDKATVSRLLQTLREAGYVAQDPVTRGYLLTSKVLRLSQGYGPGEDLRLIVRHYLSLLRDECDETVHFGVAENDSIVYVEKLDSKRSVRLVSAVGQNMPLTTTALGKAILSAIPATDRDEMLDRAGLIARTEKSITGRRALDDDLRETHRRGYSVDDEENEEGVTCVGAAVVSASSDVVGAISASGPTFRVAPQVHELGARCRATAAAISAELGASTAGAEAARSAGRTASRRRSRR